MKSHLVIAAIGALLLAPLSARTAEQTVTLTVHHANCALCAPIVKCTLEQVKGVKTVTVSQPNYMADVTAKVTFDNSAASVPVLTAATTKAGYPADVAQ
jgi:periplasmic mercuric ion binding protein